MIDGYTPLVPQTEFGVAEIFSVHYFEYSSNYAFPGESHDFWEFCYVDKGELSVTTGEQDLLLQKNEILFHKPGEFHSLRANGRVAPNLVVASFRCAGPRMDWFEDRVMTIGDEQRQLLARIVDEAGAAFLSPLDDPGLKTLVRDMSAPVGAEQMIRISLESLLISLYRLGRQPSAPQKPTSLIREGSRSQFVARVLEYFEQNIHRQLTLEDVCRDNLVGRSYLQKVFRERTGGGAMEYFGKLKIEAAKRMIREGRHNFTEIATALGYSSIHYFSRHFKKVAGMTPSEYASSVKVLTGRDRLEL